MKRIILGLMLASIASSTHADYDTKEFIKGAKAGSLTVAKAVLISKAWSFVEKCLNKENNPSDAKDLAKAARAVPAAFIIATLKDLVDLVPKIYKAHKKPDISEADNKRKSKEKVESIEKLHGKLASLLISGAVAGVVCILTPKAA